MQNPKPVELVGPLKTIHESGRDTILATVSVNGNLVTFEELCPHRAGPLSEGSLEGTRLTCPWHGSVFNLEDGSVLKGPACRSLTLHSIRD